MKTFTQFDAPGRMKIVPTWAALKSAVLHAVPGAMAGAMPLLAVWMGLNALGVVVFCLVSLALSYGFWRYQRWESRVIQDFSSIQWGEYVTGAFIGAGAVLLLPLILGFF